MYLPSGRSALRQTSAKSYLRFAAITFEKRSSKLGSDIKIADLEGAIVLGGSSFSLSRANSCQFEFEGYWIVTDASACCIQAPLRLPQNSTITGIEYIFLDVDAGGGESFEIELKRKDLRTEDDAVEIAQHFSEESPNIQTVTDTSFTHEVDAENFTYFVDLCFSGTNNRFYGAKVFYE